MTEYPTLAEVLRPVRTECPCCGQPGWTVELEDGGSVTLHSEYVNADGNPIINDACWTSE